MKYAILSSFFLLFAQLITAQNVGIGTVTPATTLEVNGDVTVDGKILSENKIAAVYEPDWSDYGNGFEGAAYFKDKMNIVHLTGMLQAASGSSTLNIFTLPVGYRPAGRLVFPAMTNLGAERVDIFSNGRVILGATIPAWLSLSGITFKAE